MPVQKSQSALFAKLGGALLKAHEAHKDDEMPQDGFSELPAGIIGGVAQLIDAKFDLYKKGENQGKPYFMAQGVVKRPTLGPKGEMIEGLRTKIGPVPVCDTPNAKGKRKTLDDNLTFVYDELRKLGVDTKTLDPRNLETTVAALKQAKPHFRFRTWKGDATADFPNPRTNHIWGGICEFDDDADIVEDATEEAGPAVIPDEPEEPATSSSTDLAALVKAATAGDEDAGSRLTELALESGADEDTIAAATDWAEVAQMIRTNQAGGPPPVKPLVASAESNGEPEKGQAGWYYHPPKAKKAVECEVTAVDKRLKTVSLKNLDNPKFVYKSVKWDQLVPKQWEKR